MCFATGEAPALRNPVSTPGCGSSTHHRQCSLRWTPAPQSSSRWCDPWRSAGSEASLRSTASADCLLTWKQHFNLPCCHMAGTPSFLPGHPAPQCCNDNVNVGSLSAQQEIYPTFNHMQLSLSSERYHLTLKACQNTLHVWIKTSLKYYSSFLLSIAEPSTELHGLWAITASSRSSQIQDTPKLFIF